MENAVTKLLSEVKKQGRCILTEIESKKLLGACGIAVSAGHVVTDPDMAVDTADRLGYPVVMKIVSPDISHKSDVEGVRVHIESPQAVRETYKDIISKAKMHRPDASIQGVLIYRMIPEGVELVIGGKPVSYAPLDAEITNQLSAAEQRRDSSPPND